MENATQTDKGQPQLHSRIKRLLRHYAQRAVLEPDFEVVLTMTKSEGYTKKRLKKHPIALAHGKMLFYKQKFLRPDKRHLEEADPAPTMEELEEKYREFFKKARRHYNVLRENEIGVTVCEFRYAHDRFETLFKQNRDARRHWHKTPESTYLKRESNKLIVTEKMVKMREQRLIERAFRPFTEQEIKKLRKFFAWRDHEKVRLAARAEYYNEQVTYWKARYRNEGRQLGKHRSYVRAYKGLYGETYWYNRRDNYVPQAAFCWLYREPLK